jgi:mannose-6-phosphate isomerase
MQAVYKLVGAIKNYDWGGNSFIPDLLKKENIEGLPYAEYWMGTHPLGMSQLEVKPGQWKGLNEFVTDLPYLLKILDVKNMLSIQVHPSKAAAARDFDAENKMGIPIDAHQRNYKDENHKPELIVALSDFWLLHGFKPEEQLVYTLLNTVELRELLPIYNQSGYAGLYKYIMEMPQQEVNRILQPLIDNIQQAEKNNGLDKNDEDYWVAKAVKIFTQNGNIDRGIFSIYLFNLVFLKKGEGMFQDAGVPHAYLEGQNVEIMANSDNVLRGGLTSKHIDVKELLKHVVCEPTQPVIITGKKTDGDDTHYETSATDFHLSVFEMRAGETVSFKPTMAEIILLTDGFAELDDDKNAVKLQPGSPSAIALPGTEVYLAAKTNATIFRASAEFFKR